MSYKLILLFVFIGILVLFSSFRRDKKRKIIFFGDSITEAGVEPNGYITVLRKMLQREGIEDYELVGSGIGGNKIYDLCMRVEKDVLSKSPDMVIIFIGVNDVWHKIKRGTGTDADKFEQFYRSLIYKLQAANITLILCTPAVIGEKKNDANAQDEDLDKYAEIISSIGNEMQLPVCNIRMLFKNYIREHNIDDMNSGILTVDGVHLNEQGNRLVANAIWDRMDLLK